MQKLMIIGNLTRDPESRAVGDKTVCNFTVAVNRRKKNDGTQEADFFRVGAWGKLGESCQKYLQKGKKVFVSGTVSVNSYTDQQGQAKASLEVFANEVEFLSAAGQSSGEQAPAEPTPVELADGELPF